jgi:aspartyl-tRNA(Asn)/glutamyl-tRNA(Gln) amidotransferase subunit A
VADNDVFTLVDRPELRAQVPAREVAELFLERAERLQPTVHALFALTPEVARSDAARVDEARAAGRRLPLDGMPIVVKDNVDVAGVRTTNASSCFADNVPAEDAESVRRLRDAGALVLGKAALHEFAYGVTCRNDAYGTCRNPWALDRIPGGSSGGSGAAVAADLCVGAVGTDTGGSVRIPAALNGVTGLRPTFGAISNRGVHHIGWSFDTVGPLARSARDVAELWTVLAGYDPGDPRAVPGPVPDPRPGLDAGLAGVRVGIARGFFVEGLEPDIARSLEEAASTLAGLGAEVVDVEIPDAAEAQEICLLLIRADALAAHRGRLEQTPELMGEDVRRRLALGAQISGADYSAMQQRMLEWRRGLHRLLEDVDIVTTPTTNAVAPRLEDSETIATTEQLTRFTYPWSAGHLPAASVPCGMSAEGLPIGLQLAAGPWRDGLLLRAAAAFQTVTDWHLRRPPLEEAAAA